MAHAQREPFEQEVPDGAERACKACALGHRDISVGDGGNELMLARMRAHTNFAENTPIFLILLGLIEFNSHATMWLWLAGITFIVARILHAFGMERPAPNVLRAAGMLSTIALILALAIYGIVLSYAAG